MYFSTEVSCLQALNSMNSHSKVPEVDCTRTGKDSSGQQGRQRALTDTHSNIFVLRKMVEEVFSVLYSKLILADFLSVFGCNQRKDNAFLSTALCCVLGEAVGKSSLVPVPYDWILKDPSSVVVYGLPDGVTLRKPSEYDTKTLMKILEQSNRIRFIVKRSVFCCRLKACSHEV